MNLLQSQQEILIFMQIIISRNLPAFEKKTHTRTGRHSHKICFKKLTSDVSRFKNIFNELILDLSLIQNKCKQTLKIKKIITRTRKLDLVRL